MISDILVIFLLCLANSILGVFISIEYFQLANSPDNIAGYMHVMNIRNGVTALTVSMEVIVNVLQLVNTCSGIRIPSFLM